MGANLVRLWRLTGKDEYRGDVDDLLAASAGAIATNLFSAAGTLNALDLRLATVDVVLVKPPGTDAAAMLAAIRRYWTPSLVLSLHDEEAMLPDSHPAAGKRAIDGKATVYICRGETCSLPVTEPQQISELLGS
jgi:uncharacterized protein YyaL (SSP411 family)